MRTFMFYENLRAATLAVFGLALTSLSAHAEVKTYQSVITFGYTGEPEEGMFSPSAIVPGDRFLLTFTIDDSAIDTNGTAGVANFGGAATMSLARDPGNIGSFDFEGVDFKPSASFSIEPSGVGSLRFVNILFFPDQVPELLIPAESIYFGSSNVRIWDISLRFFTPEKVADIGVGQTLASRLPDASLWSGFYVFPNYSFEGVQFTISNIAESTSPEAVPEPSVWALGLVGLGLGAWWRRRQQAR